MVWVPGVRRVRLQKLVARGFGAWYVVCMTTTNNNSGAPVDRFGNVYPVRYLTAKGEERWGRVNNRRHIASDGVEYVTLQPVKGAVQTVPVSRVVEGL